MSSISVETYNAIMIRGKMPKTSEPPPPELAVWPEPLYIRGKWWMCVYRLMSDMSLKWGKSNPPELFNNLEEALKIAKQRNKNLLENISVLPITLDQQETITIKVNKELQKKERLVNEEKLMLQEAQRRAKTRRKPEINELILPERSEKFRQTLHAQLITMPYLSKVLVSEKNKQFILERSKENELKWSQPISAKKKAIE